MTLSICYMGKGKYFLCLLFKFYFTWYGEALSWNYSKTHTYHSVIKQKNGDNPVFSLIRIKFLFCPVNCNFDMTFNYVNTAIYCSLQFRCQFNPRPVPFHPHVVIFLSSHGNFSISSSILFLINKFSSKIFFLTWFWTFH